jgi:hypothetical protein
MHITYQKFIIGILAIIIIIFAIKLYKTYRENNKKYNKEYNKEYNTDYIENFESVLNKLKSKSKENFNNTSNFKKQGNKAKLKKKVTFEDLLKDTEDIDPGKYTVSEIKNNFFKYVNSFNTSKFTNVTGTTTESLDKFSYFKDKFFEIFK